MSGASSSGMRDYGRSAIQGGLRASAGSLGGLTAADRHGNNMHERPGQPVAGPGNRGTWLSNQQYREYLELLKERARAQAPVSVPLERVGYPALPLNVALSNRTAYGVTQPGYSFLAPAGTAAKASGYAGVPSLHPVEFPPQSR